MDPHRVNYVRHFVPLSLWYVHRTVTAGEVALAEALDQRVNIYRLTDLYDGEHHPARGHDDPTWRALVEQLGHLYERHHAQSSAFEREGLELLWPRLLARLRQPSSAPPAPRPFECWTFDHADDRVSLHIANVYQPRSPLGEMFEPFARSLLRLVRHVRRAHPGVTTVGCGSWLNDVPRFAQLFPRSWLVDVEVVEPIRYTMGHWGQFTDRRGDFHHAHGRRMRETGRLPFRCLRCRCRVDELLDHLVPRLSAG